LQPLSQNINNNTLAMSNIDQAGNIPNGSAASINASANANLDALKTSKVRFCPPPILA
jgi:hypothetical protein